MTTQTVTFLIVEDDVVGFKALQRAFQQIKVANPIRHAKDGVEALDILRGSGGQERIESPYVILLDLNMPRISGLEFLDVIRKDPDQETAVVFVLTTSLDEEDRLEAYCKHVAGYILKSDPGDSFLKAVTMLDHYWRVVEFPET